MAYMVVDVAKFLKSACFELDGVIERYEQCDISQSDDDDFFKEWANDIQELIDKFDELVGCYEDGER